MTIEEIDFFSAIWGDGLGYGEIRLIGPKGIDQLFYALPLPPYVAGDLAADAHSYDVYFGVLPRLTQKGDAASCARETSVLWADIDAKNFPSKADALSTINRMIAVPQIVVDSGHGYHVYWLLKSAIPVVEAQQRMKALEAELGADHCSDAPRILRVPGTLNHKDDPPLPVRIVRYDLERRYRASDFPLPPPAKPKQWPPSRLQAHDLPQWIGALIREGTPKGQRSEACFRVALWMTRYGYTSTDIRQTFESTPNGIGAKYAERGDKWLNYVINAAKEAA